MKQPEAEHTKRRGHTARAIPCFRQDSILHVVLLHAEYLLYKRKDSVVAWAYRRGCWSLVRRRHHPQMVSDFVVPETPQWLRPSRSALPVSSCGAQRTRTIGLRRPQYPRSRTHQPLHPCCGRTLSSLARHRRGSTGPWDWQ